MKIGMFPNKKELENGIGIIFTKTGPCKESIDCIDQLSYYKSCNSYAFKNHINSYFFIKFSSVEIE